MSILQISVAWAILLCTCAVLAHDGDDHHHLFGDHHLEVHQFKDGKLATKKPAPADNLTPGRSHHHCIHDKVKMSEDAIPKVPQNYGSKNSSSMSREFRQLAYSNIRLQAFFDVDNLGHCGAVGATVDTYQSSTVSCTAADVLTPIMKDYVMNVLVAQALAFMNSALNVVPVTDTLILGSSTCNGVTIPQSHQTSGVANADMVFYITVVPLAGSANSQTVAWATTCMRDQNGRPIAGHINFVPQALKNAAVRNEVTQYNDFMTATHEMNHALGYSSPFFGSYGYVDIQGGRVMDGSGLTVTTDATLGKQVTKMTSPRVIAKARKFFNCPTLDGVEIEDQGGAGTQGSHWEKRILYQEFIAGVMSTVRTWYSSLTLAYFEDTGFYTANYGVAQDANMNWARNHSCAVVQQKCNSQQISTGEFCFDTDPASRYCTYDRLGKGYCATSNYDQSLPSYFQYFAGQPARGSSVSVSDYCPAVLPYNNVICIDSSASDAQDIYGSTYSSRSRCFVSNLISTDFSVGSLVDSRCFTYTCSSGQLIVGVQGQSAYCPTDGSAGQADTSTLSGFHGTIMCPEASLFCAPLGPTPAPTPAPPTPAPTAAPPGYTPAPGPTYRPNTPAPTLPATCTTAKTCADNLAWYMPFCRKMADALLSCFGTICSAGARDWLVEKQILCSDPATYGAARCVEGYVGGVAMCALTS